MKKFISIALTFVVILSTLPIVSTSAISTTESKTGAANDTAISALDYEEGTFPPEEMSTEPAVEGEGMCGETVYFNCSFDTYTLKIWGNGDMWDNYSFDYYAFFMDSLVISDGVNSIGVNSFTGFKIKTVTISSSLRYIKQGAFKDCNNLTDVYYQGTQSQWNEIVIADENDCLLNADIHFIETPTEAAMPEPTEPVTLIDSGECGANAYWDYYDDGRLIVHGTGHVYEKSNIYRSPIDDDYDEFLKTKDGYPWYKYRDKIKAVVFEGVNNVPRYAFTSYPNLESVLIGDEITTLGSCEYEVERYDGEVYSYTYTPDTFARCEKLKTVSLGKNISYIDSNTFLGCVNLLKINLPDSLKGVGENAFSNCLSLAEISFPEDFDNFTYSSFANTAFTNNENNWTSGILYINNYAVKAKGTLADVCNIKNGTKKVFPSAFSECSNVKQIVIPDSVTSLGIGSFSGCSNLSFVKLGKGITSIPANCFSGCSELNEINIGNNIKSIGSCAFSGCEKIQSIEIPDSVTSLGKYTFYECKYLYSVKLGKGITSIPERCFNGCTNLEDINIGNNIETIGDGAFAGSGFVRVFVPDNVTYLGSFAFGGCSNLKEVRIGKGIEIINCG